MLIVLSLPEANNVSAEAGSFLIKLIKKLSKRILNLAMSAYIIHSSVFKKPLGFCQTGQLLTLDSRTKNLGQVKIMGH
jgi:hypothetical protein